MTFADSFPAPDADPLPELPILYRDERMVAVAKPEKMLVHRTEIANGDTVFAMQCVREQIGAYVWPVHRLDRGTSGVLLFALSAEAASVLGRVMMAGGVRKRYAAIVRGWVAEPVDVRHALSLPEDPYLKHRTKTEPQSARTLFRPVAKAELPVPCGTFPTTRLGLVEAELLTGRRHQIRRHLKWLAHPIIGDATYGKGPLNRALAPALGTDRLMLHCARMSLTHPWTGERLELRADPAGALASAMAVLGWQEAYARLADAPWQSVPEDWPVLA